MVGLEIAYRSNLSKIYMPCSRKRDIGRQLGWVDDVRKFFLKIHDCGVVQFMSGRQTKKGPLDPSTKTKANSQ